MENDIIGKIHSIETCGTVDGPGIRFVLFMQGCPLRCKYCHNPDTWNMSHGKDMSASDVIKEVKKYKAYMNFSGGGITITGGEPLLQINFVTEILKKCKDQKIHTAIDTSGYVDIERIDAVLQYTDLVLLDIKSYNKDVFKNLTGVELDKTLNLAKHLSDIQKPTWIRYVVVPGITDNKDDIEELVKFISTLKNVEVVEILPFHKMGEYKWRELDYNYELRDVEPPSRQTIGEIKNIFEQYNIKTR